MKYMKLTQNKKNLILALLVLNMLSACGKNMNLRQAGLANKSGDASDPLTFVKVAGGSMSESDKNPPDQNNSDPNNEVPSNDNSKKKKNALDKDNLASLNGELDRWSNQDLKEMTSFPFKNEDGTNEEIIRAVGFPAAKTPTSNINYVKHSNVVFRSVLQIPKREWVKKIKSLNLVLENVVRFNESEVPFSDLSNQILCLYDGKDGPICSGDESIKNRKLDQTEDNANGAFWTNASIVNDEFARAVLAKDDLAILNDNQGNEIGRLRGADLSEQDKKSKTPPVAGTLTFDLRKLFNLSSKDTDLDKLSDAQVKEIMDFLYDHSTEYADGNYRKFRFVIGNNVYVDSGRLDLQFDLTDEGVKAAPPAVTDINLVKPVKVDDVALPVMKDVQGDLNETKLPTPKNDQQVVDDTKPEVKDNANVTDDNKDKNDKDKKDKNKDKKKLEQGETVNPEKPSNTDMNSNRTVGITIVGTHPRTEITLSDFKLQLNGSMLTFVSGSALIPQSQKKWLNDFAKKLRDKKQLVQTIYIFGVADGTGSDKINKPLSQKRADAVAAIFKGIVPATSLNSKGIGASNPPAEGCLKGKRCDDDRRVDIGIKFVNNKDGDTVTLLNDLNDFAQNQIKNLTIKQTNE